jgi:heptosyltransferase-2
VSAGPADVLPASFMKVKLESKDIRRIVVRGTNWAGDAVMTVPALRELRRLLPDAHLTLATRAFAEGIFKGADFLDDLLLYDREPGESGSVFGKGREWRRRRFDLAVLFQNAFEAALIGWIARVPCRIGYATQQRGWLLTHPLPLPEWLGERHESFYYLNIVAQLETLLHGASKILDREPVFDLNVASARQTEGRAILHAHGVRAGSPIVALCPGSINSRAKRWPAERYAALADRFIEETGANVLLIGSAAELEVSREVSKHMRREPLMLTGKTDLAQAVAILSLVDLLVTNDTGPAHIASALGRPTLVIFGPTNPLTTRPLSLVAEIVRHPPDCAPCMLRDCPIDHRCMTAITPDEVFARAYALLARTGLATEAQRHRDSNGLEVQVVPTINARPG